MKKIIILGLVLLGLTSCSPSYYPQKFNTPLLREEGEKKVNAAANLNSINVQVSSALTEKFALAASFNGFYVRSGEVLVGGSTVTDATSSGFQVDIMPGLYVPFGDIGVVELYGGLGTGFTNSEEVSGLLHRVIFQPSIGISGERFEFAFSCRFTHVLIPKSSLLEENPTTFSETFLEPGLIFRFGSDKIKFTSQIGISIPVVNIPEGDISFVQWNPLILNFGVQLYFSEGWK